LVFYFIFCNRQGVLGRSAQLVVIAFLISVSVKLQQLLAVNAKGPYKKHGCIATAMAGFFTLLVRPMPKFVWQ